MKPRLSWKKLRDCPHLMDRSTVPKQVCRGLHLQLACFAPPILQHFPSQKVLLSGENIFACSPSKLPNFVWNIKPPKPLPEFPQLTSIRHWSLVLLGCHLHSYLVSTSNWELPIGCRRPYQFIIRQMQAQSDTSYQISLIRHEKPLQKIKFPYTQVMVNKVANPRNIKRQGWWWYHLVTGRSWKPPIYLAIS